MSEWISVEDRLPDEIGTYLTYWPNDGSIETYDRDCTIMEEGWESDLRMCGRISHYMPLPQPPEAE